MVNRLILNLVQGADNREDTEFRTRTGLEPPSFAAGSFLGDIGGPVRTLPDDMDDELYDGDESDTDGISEIEDVPNPEIGGDGEAIPSGTD